MVDAHGGSGNTRADKAVCSFFFSLSMNSG